MSDVRDDRGECRRCASWIDPQGETWETQVSDPCPDDGDEADPVVYTLAPVVRWGGTCPACEEGTDRRVTWSVSQRDGDDVAQLGRGLPSLEAARAVVRAVDPEARRQRREDDGERFLRQMEGWG